jgi:hypothetical protein
MLLRARRRERVLLVGAPAEHGHDREHEDATTRAAEVRHPAVTRPFRVAHGGQIAAVNDFMRAANVATVLTGVDLPAHKQELVAYATREGAEHGLTAALERLPEREYRSLDDVAEALVPVQPASKPDDPIPGPESGAPPGGPDYVEANPSPGAVRHRYPG